MNRTLLLLTALILSLSLKAQDEGIIDLLHDSCFSFTNPDMVQYPIVPSFDGQYYIFDNDYIFYTFDIDKDGEGDLWALMNGGYDPGSPMGFMIRSMHPKWELSKISDEEAYDAIELSLVNTYEQDPFGYGFDMWHNDYNYDTVKLFHYGIRHSVMDEDGDLQYCYGWIEGYIRAQRGEEPYSWPLNTFCFERMYYCPIPDYPLHWGQTTFEETAIDQIVVRPNPTDGSVIINGRLFVDATVYDPLGRIVIKQKVRTGSVYLDFSHLRNGLYFVCLNDSEGKHYLKKIIKR